MNKRRADLPGRPRSPTPPDALVKLADSLVHEQVAQVGLTTTRDGEWALLLKVKKGTPTPIREIETAHASFPIVYDEEPDEPPVARPAYPRRGE